MNKRPSQGNLPEPGGSGGFSPRLRLCRSKFGTGHLYFAYGSNLRSAQMARLCPQHVFLGPACLKDHRLAFTLPDAEWQGGVADIMESGGEEVWGALYGLSDAGLPLLDAYEGFDPQGPAEANDYVRRKVRLASMTPDHLQAEAWTYFVREPRGHVAPSAIYRDALIEGALERGLPAAYIETMRRAFVGPDR